jgi:hypothetical protein
VPGGQGGLGDLAAEAAGAAGQQEDLAHVGASRSVVSQLCRVSAQDNATAFL